MHKPQHESPDLIYPSITFKFTEDQRIIILKLQDITMRPYKLKMKTTW